MFDGKTVQNPDRAWTIYTAKQFGKANFARGTNETLVLISKYINVKIGVSFNICRRNGLHVKRNDFMSLHREHGKALAGLGCSITNLKSLPSRTVDSWTQIPRTRKVHESESGQRLPAIEPT